MIGQRFPAVDVEVVHDQMNDFREWLGGDQFPNHLRELEGASDSA